MENKISVIVPVYNVEPYLHRCLDSITGQTYQNLQIILIDDGSKDAGSSICDEYAARDSRIEVIHKPNGGLSSARNVGLTLATGDWIGWVDSDDWVDSEMFETMLNAALQHDADVAVCSYLETYPNRTVFHGWQQTVTFNRDEGMRMLLENGDMKNTVWDKLWKRELFNGVQFPEGRTYEDIAVAHLLFEHAEKFVCLPNAFYHYVQRSASIIDDPSLRNKMNHYLAAKDRLDSIGDKYPEYRYLMEAQCVASAVGLWCCYYRNPAETREQYLPQLKEISSFARKHAKVALQHMDVGAAGRIVIHMLSYTSWWAFGISWVIGLLYKKKNGRAI